MDIIESELLPTSVPLGGRDSDGSERTTPEVSSGRARIPLLEAVREHSEVSGMLEMADEFLAGQGFTEHGFRHANLVGHIAFNVLTHLGFDERLAELGAVSGYLHDIGNVVSRSQHGQSSGLIAFTILRELDVPIRDIAHIMGAAGNHEEQYGVAVSPVSAAVIVADKSDVHRSRVRDTGDIETDIHDRVNFAVTSSFLRVSDAVQPEPMNPEEGYEAELDEVRKDQGLPPQNSTTPARIGAPMKTLTLELEVDTSVTPVFEYFEIFMERMVMCRRAGRTLGAEFKITVNDVPVL
ncbi:MAG: phosphohydrolase [Euzebya sp.]